MGLIFSSAAERERKKQVSLAIDLILDEDNRRLSKEVKILILGGSESCRSTLLKQMKVIHQDGYSREELETFRNAIYKDVVDSAQSLVLAMVKMQKEFSRPENKVMADLVLEYSVKTDPSFILTPRIVDAIDSLYHDPMTAIIMDRCDFGQMDSTLYFISQVRRIGIDTYTPSVQDVLRVKPRTTGISETRFHMGQISVHMIDVGQTRSDRKKWIHCFESVTSIIFCVALSDYDLVLREEPGQNRMAENLVLFESVVNSRWFRQTAIILLMTDVDLFAAKLPKVPLENFFPDYTGGADISKAAKYILWRYSQTNRARLPIYPHMTHLTDTLNIRLVFASLKEIVLQNALKSSGIL